MLGLLVAGAALACALGYFLGRYMRGGDPLGFLALGFAVLMIFIYGVNVYDKVPLAQSAVALFGAFGLGLVSSAVRKPAGNKTEAPK